MLEGKVKWFSKAKGYGFIRPDGGKEDVFVHISDLHASGYEDLQKNDEVEFELLNSDKGLRAINITIFEYV